MKGSNRKRLCLKSPIGKLNALNVYSVAEP